MKTYSIILCSGKPVWKDVPPLYVDHLQWTPPCDIRMSQRICYDASAIYVQQSAVEKEIRAECRDEWSMICQDSCMEFFIRPEKAKTYLNFEWNYNACLYLGIGTGRQDRVRLTVPNARDFFHACPTKTDDGWKIEYQIPLRFLNLFYPDLVLEKGTGLEANCYKCGDLTVQPHYLTWNFVDVPTPDYHRPEYFGKMVLI